ncbi:hypothetical protein [Stieleria varia]|uniref:hypothetical protein n=1 Tax=Stieleria varia TaxID=2528005 RepID=UPI0011B7D389|nr:hypothetical protein [Stieleria varia]
MIQNFRTQLPWQGPADSVRLPSHHSLQAARDAKQLNAAQQDVFLAPRPEIELYNFREDPHQLVNLAGQPETESTQKHLQEILRRWMDETGDSVPEKISPDTFDRETGKRIPASDVDTTGVLTPGSDRKADHFLAPGPR